MISEKGNSTKTSICNVTIIVNILDSMQPSQYYGLKKQCDILQSDLLRLNMEAPCMPYYIIHFPETMTSLSISILPENYNDVYAYCLLVTRYIVPEGMIRYRIGVDHSFINVLH